MSKKLTTDDVVRRCKSKHGDKYDYTNVVYVDQKTKVSIICKDHGEWRCLPTNHYVLGQGCPSCGRVSSAALRTNTPRDVVRNARDVHGNRYEYIESTYKNTYTPMSIICPDHGPFDMKPNSHISGRQGCPRCVGKHKTSADWIVEFRRVHGDRYEYPVVVPKSTTKMVVKCPDHGTFLQTPSMHRWGQGCPGCSYTNHRGRYSDVFFHNHPDQKTVPASVYVLEVTSSHEHFIKVGITTTSVNQRIRNTRTTTYNIRTLFEQELPLFVAFELEQKLLAEFKQFVYTPGEHFPGNTECLLPTCYTNLITTIKENIHV